MNIDFTKIQAFIDAIEKANTTLSDDTTKEASLQALSDAAAAKAAQAAADLATQDAVVVTDVNALAQAFQDGADAFLKAKADLLATAPAPAPVPVPAPVPAP